VIGDECGFAIEDVDELVLPVVTVVQGRLSAGPQSREVHAESLQAKEVTQRSGWSPCLLLPLIPVAGTLRL
jgi:hypothetical protein